MSALRAVVAAADPEVAAFAVPDPPTGEWEQQLADPDRAFVMEAVYEGFLVHYREPRAFAGMDPDMRLLAGDTLYALGLDRLAASGDLPAVAALADLISACARAEAESRPEDIAPLWQATARQLGA